MPASTGRLALPYPTPDDTVDVPRDVQALAVELDPDMAVDAQGTLAARPAAGLRGRYYWATDTKQLFRDNGATWDEPGGPEPWQAMDPLTGGWGRPDGNRPPRYYRQSGVVRLNGQIGAGTIGQAAFTLPVGYRPLVVGGTAGFSHAVVATNGFGSVNVLPNGQVIPSAGSTTWVDLSSISFRCVA